jgi:putative redox protein
VKVEVEQVDGRRFVIRARGNEIVVDDTLEAGGPGDGFRPTELLLGALASCMMGTMISFARGQQVSVEGVRMLVDCDTADHPDRISSIHASMSLRTDAEPRRQQTLRRVASACKIHNTLAAEPVIEFSFEVEQ